MVHCKQKGITVMSLLELGQGRPSSPKEGLGRTHMLMMHQLNQPCQ